MEIFNHCDLVTTSQIESLISLLPKKSHSQFQDTVFVIYGDVEHALQEAVADEKTVENIKKGEVHGAHLGDANTILIFAFNFTKYKTDQLKKTLFAFILFHEMRHRLQMVFANEWFMKENESYCNNPSEEIYENQPLEMDANAYAELLVNANSEEISEIFKFNSYRWEIKCESPKKLLSLVI